MSAPFARHDVSIPVGSSHLAAWAYEPTGAGPHPVVVLGHGFAAIRAARLDAFAERFAAAGLGCVVFDYRHFGDSPGLPRHLLDIGRQLEDWRAAVAYARRHPRFDPDRVALWGSSFSGGHVLALAAEDDRLAAVVSQVPFVDGRAASGAAPPRAVARLAAAAVADTVAGALRRGPVYVPVVGAPGSLAVMSSPDALPGYLGIVPEGAPWENEVAARVALRVLGYRPGRQAHRITAALLVVVAGQDAVTPPGPAREVAARAPRAELVEYPIGHFDIYTGEWFERAVADEEAFLRAHLLADA